MRTTRAAALIAAFLGTISLGACGYSMPPQTSTATVSQIKTTASPQEPERPSKNMRLVMHLKLERYTDTTQHDRFSHGCNLSIGATNRYMAVGTMTGEVIVRYDTYARIGQATVTTQVDSNDISFFEGARSIWRECRGKESNGIGRFYVVTEGFDPNTRRITLSEAHPGGIQIFRVNGKETVLAATYVGHFNTAHTITINGNLALVNGANWYNSDEYRANPRHEHEGHIGGMRALSLVDPENPIDLSGFGEVDDKNPSGDIRYTHDSYVLRVGNWTIAYLADIYRGWIRVVDLTNPIKPTVIDSVRTPMAAAGAKVSAHNIGATADGRWLFNTEETPGSGLNVFDNSNPLHPKLCTTYRPAGVADSSIAHNVVVRGKLAFVSWYTEGVRVFDVSDPCNPQEVAYFDSSDMTPTADPSNPRISEVHSAACQGNWSVVVDPEGRVIIVDMQNGVYVLELSNKLKQLLK